MTRGGKRGKYDPPVALDMDFGEALERFAQTKPEEVSDEQAKGQALRLVQKEDGGPSFLIYATDRGVKTELRFKGESPWFTTRQMADIFGVDTDTVLDHVNNFVGNGELDEATTGKFPVVQNEGGRSVRREVNHYGLDVAFYVGYRVNSAQGVLFRRWATAVLIQIAKHGYYIDKERLKDPDDPGIVEKVRSELYEIRASTGNAYREVLKIVSKCQDYDGQKPARDFFARVENRLLYAATGRTAPEMIKERADARQPDMGLTYFTGKNGPIKRDVTVGDNYLYQDEAERKNRITVMLLDYFVDQADQGRLVTMGECEKKVADFIGFNQWELLSGGGAVSRPDADAHALAQYERFTAGDIEGDPVPLALPKPIKRPTKKRP